MDLEIPMAVLVGNGEYEVEIVGEKAYFANLKDITGGTRPGGVRQEVQATLWHQKDNPHDPNAIMVVIQAKLVGYLARDDAAEMVEFMVDNDLDGYALSCPAVILGGRPGENFGVCLDIDWPPEVLLRSEDLPDAT